MKKVLKEISKIRTYAVICGIVLGLFSLATTYGYKIIGDDNETKEQSSSNLRRGGRTYHK